MTIVAEVEITLTLNSRPLTFVSAEDLDEPLTPSHLLVGYRLNNLPDPLCDDNRDPTYGEAHSSFDLSKRLKHLSVMLKHFWNRWQREYLTELSEHHRYSRGSAVQDLIQIGDVILFDKNLPRTLWKLARVVELICGNDGVVRGACVRTKSETGHSSILR